MATIDIELDASKSKPTIEELDKLIRTEDVDVIARDKDWPATLEPLGDLLRQYEDLLPSCDSRQKLADETLQFVKKKLHSECGCIRTSKYGEVLGFVSCDCVHATKEERLYALKARTIITRAADKEIAIVEGDQGLHPSNGRMGEDEGSLISVALKRALSSERFQLTCCETKQFFFKKHHALVVHYILRRMEAAALVLRYRDQQTTFSHMVAKYINSSLAKIKSVGPDVADREVASLVKKATAGLGEIHAWFIGAGRDQYPTFVPTEGTRANRNSGGWRPAQAEILALVAKANNAPLIAFWRKREKNAMDPVKDAPDIDQGDILYTVGEDPMENSLPPGTAVSSDWTEGLSVGVVPIVFEDKLLAFLWLERETNVGFSKEEIDQVRKCLDSETKEYVVDKAAELSPQPLRTFTALGCTPDMALARREIAYAVKRSDESILIGGMAGTGKSYVAKVIHFTDPVTKDKPFIEISCEESRRDDFQEWFAGKFRGSEGGTLVFDGLDHYPSRVRLYLMNLVRGRRYSYSPTDGELVTRFIGVVNLTSDTDHIPREHAQMFDRVILLPPLQRRTQEIECIIACWLQNSELSAQYPGRFLVDPKVLERLKKHSWRGNLTELLEVIKKMCENAGPELELRLEHMPTRLFHQE